MKKLTCVFLIAVTLAFLCPVLASPVAAGDNEIIGQGITLVETPVYISDSKGWREVATKPAGTPIAVYFYDSSWVYNDPNQKMPRWIQQGWRTVRAVGIYGVDKVRETNWGKPLLASTGPLLIGEVVFAGSNCKKMSGPGYGADFNYAPEGTRMLVQNKSNGWLFVLVNGNPKEPCWVPESKVRRGTTVADGYVDEAGATLIAIGSITNHLGQGRAIAVTAEQAREAVQLALQGKVGTLYTRPDGRILIDIVRGGYRYVAFLDADGQLGSFFPPAERHQVAGEIHDTANYINNVINKGGYWRVQASQIPQQIKDLWLPVVTGSSLVQQFLNLAQSEVFFMMFIAPEDWNRYFEPQGLGPTNL